MYNTKDQQHILFLKNKLHNMTMKEGSDVSTYLMEARTLRNHLVVLGETISDNQLINVVLNGLPCSYDMVVQGVSYLPNPTYEDDMGRILTETHGGTRTEAWSRSGISSSSPIPISKHSFGQRLP
jgi:hypothetical protein